MAKFDYQLFQKCKEVFSWHWEMYLKTLKKSYGYSGKIKISHKQTFLEIVQARYYYPLKELKNGDDALNIERYLHLCRLPHYYFPLRLRITGSKRDPIYLEHRGEHYQGCDFLYWMWEPLDQFPAGATEEVWKRLRPYIRKSAKDGERFVPVFNYWRMYHWKWGFAPVIKDWYQLTGEPENCELIGF